MRAVNLIPGEAGRGGRGAAGAGPYVLLGVLGVVLVAALAYVLTHNTLVERRAELASMQTQAAQAQVQANEVRPYREFAALADARVETVRGLGATRFDWHRAFGDLATVIPDNVWLISLLGTVTTGVSVEGASSSGETATIRSALPNPAIELSGCTTDQDSVARMMSRLRLMHGVVRVSLATSSKDEGSGTEDCRYGDPRFPQFGIVVFFDTLPAPPAASGATPAAGATTTASSTSTPTPSADSGGATSTGSDMR